ncbi:Holliday junction branch migration protein RuvA [Mangrovibacterium diazotrophicum]|uniref:Holliday junction branch migration complex subunit RuvA n=1 Tax=Mangrovibacterium diazotrophicum TaxID=1261403 RepID=A0A419W8X8_9BACT|nr:Holliday junction branch migration protein RuvA [Mangrovibacterium diazotrophicum]RKD91921.1 Holliday junction DNA helicase subunit RuvA [Mangrovibacterium diazotrophicum]
MYEYISGKITGLTPANAVIEAGSIGYFIHISLNTYSAINGKQSVILYLHQVVREDAHLLYGFADQAERELFRLLISVNGIGSSTALMMLSSLTPDEIKRAILEENVNLLKSIKGIGAKTAQRVIIDLKDKIGKQPVSDQILMTGADNTIRDEALSALVMLGFARKSVEKELDKILKTNPGITVEQMIKAALKSL